MTSRPSLQISHSDAEKRIKSRILKGQKLLEIKIVEKRDWENARVEKQKWHDYNLELLKRIVDTDDLARNYDPPRITSASFSPTLDYLRNKFTNDVKYYLGNLASILERLELMPEAPSLRSKQSLQNNPVSLRVHLHQRIKLFQLLCDHFSESELKTLCFHLGVDYDSLPDVGKDNKVRELIVLLERQERIQELIEEGKKLRPNPKWDMAEKD